MAKRQNSVQGGQTEEHLQYLQVDQRLLNDASMQSDWSSKKLVWVVDPTEGFIAASIVEEGQDDVTVQIADSGKKVKVPKGDVQRMNPPKFNKIDDMAHLTHLNEASVLFNLKDRYYSGFIYTYSGLFCVVVNPYKRLPIYNEAVVEYYNGRKRHERPPHVFAIAEQTYRNMLQDREDQSILCTGESGAGKTENAKRVIQYLASVASSTKNARVTASSVMAHMPGREINVGELEAQLLQANPILEAFGNAKTIKNDNSSRFGKFIRINFDNSGYICGANIETYLLEKARVIRQAPEERSFHIHYQLLVGAPPALRQTLLMDDVSKYAYLSNGHIKLPGVDETSVFKETDDAMNIMGFSPEEKESVFRVVSAVLHFGNMQFSQERNSDQATLPDNTAAQKACHLLGLPVTELTKAFLKPRIKVGRETVTKAQTKEQVEFAVEAISKAVYERLFRWIVIRLNKSLDRGVREGNAFIGILDIAGFEIFQVNAFEQLCINFTNEKLQQLFNHTMFVLEQEEYRREGIEWDFIDFGLDLQPTIDLIEKPMGILALLDEECFFPKATDKSFVEKLFNAQGKHPKLTKTDFRATADFGVVHYAGRVDYQASQWLVKNMDPLNENVVALLQASSDGFVQQIWKDAEIVGMSATAAAEGAAATFGGPSRSRKGMLRTVGQLYKEQLTKLMSVLNHTTANFVRCIIPNHEKKPGKIDSLLVLEQLRCNGVLEGIRICRQGYPNRILFQEFKQRYEILTPNVIPKGFMDGRKAVELMIKALELEDKFYRIGQSKVFFKTGILAHLEEERDEKLTNILIKFQALSRGFLARKNFQKRIEHINAVRVIQRNAAAFLRLRNWSWWRLLTKVKPLLSVTRHEEEIAKKEEETRKVREALDKIAQEHEEAKKVLSQLSEDKTQLLHELNKERESALYAEESRQNLLQKLKQLEMDCTEMEVKEAELQEKWNRGEEERRKLAENNLDLQQHLEDEESQRQRLQLEKANIEQKMKAISEEYSLADDKLNKLTKEKKAQDERIEELVVHLTEEEEKSKSLNKLKTKYETTISELEERLQREFNSKQDLERAKRRLEAEGSEKQEHLQDYTRQLQELQAQVEQLRQQLAKLQAQLDEETTLKNNFMKQLREAENTILELREDLESEKQARDRAEKQRRDMQEDLESMREEMTGMGSTSEVQLETLRKKEKEFTDLRSQMDAANKQYEIQLQDLRKKHASVVEERESQLDQLQRAKASFEKAKQQSDAELSKALNEVKTLQAARVEQDKRRKQMEAQLTELSQGLQESENSRKDLESRLARVSEGTESLSHNNEILEARNNQLEKAVAQLENQLSTFKSSLEDETKQKLSLQSRMRQLEAEVEQYKDALEEEESNKKILEKQAQSNAQQVVEFKKKLEEELRDREQQEEMRKKLNREKETLQAQVDTLVAKLDSQTKLTRKLQAEMEDASMERDSQRTEMVNNQRKVKKFETQLQEAQALLARTNENLEHSEREKREKETRILQLQHEMEDLKDQLAASDKQRMALDRDLQDALTKGGVAKDIAELERANNDLINRLKEAEANLENAEDDLAAVEQVKDRLEVQLTAQKQQFERDLAARDEQVEELRRQMAKKMREIESEVEDERKQRSGLVTARKKLEAEHSEMLAQLEAISMERDDAVKQLRKFQSSSGSLQRDLEDAMRGREEALNHLKELEKRLKSLELARNQAQEEMAQCERIKKAAIGERDELVEQVNQANAARNQLLDERKRTEAQMARLEEELEEHQSHAEATEERYKKAMAQVDQMQSEIFNERVNLQKSETQRVALEKQVKEMRDKLAEMEKDGGRKAKAQLLTLESRVRSLEEQLDAETKEKQTLNKNVRRFEKKIKEMLVQMEEERRQADHHKEQYEKMMQQAKKLRRDQQEMDEENTSLKGHKRRLQRELDDMTETKEALEREVLSLRSRLNRDRIGAPTSRPSRRDIPDDTTDDGGASERSITQE